MEKHLSQRKASRVYPLEIKALHGDDERVYMSPGHHDPHVFMQALRDYGDSGVERGEYCVPTHEWVRAVPDRSGECICFYYDAIPGSRGSFPATYTRWYGEEQYYPPDVEKPTH